MARVIFKQFGGVKARTMLEEISVELGAPQWFFPISIEIGLDKDKDSVNSYNRTLERQNRSKKKSTIGEILAALYLAIC